ncbi:MAG: hypothetical protein ACRD50_07630 [Candidatus Acidiferrales bacterium]
MKAGAMILAAACILGSSLGTISPQSTAGDSSPCAVVQQALNDAQQIKIGITRKQVEKYFQRDGGLQVPGNTRYVYPKCDYIKLEVEFTATGSVGHLFSPDDVVTKVSNLTIGYPIRD